MERNKVCEIVVKNKRKKECGKVLVGKNVKNEEVIHCLPTTFGYVYSEEDTNFRKERCFVTKTKEVLAVGKGLRSLNLTRFILYKGEENVFQKRKNLKHFKEDDDKCKTIVIILESPKQVVFVNHFARTLTELFVSDVNLNSKALFSIGQLNQLTTLFLNRCHLNQFTQVKTGLAFKNMRYLRHLSLRFNDLTDFLCPYGSWNNLEILDLSYNHLNSLSENLWKLKFLHTLKVQKNHYLNDFKLLSEMPKLPLKSLNIVSTSLQLTEIVNFCPLLHDLHVSENVFHEIFIPSLRKLSIRTFFSPAYKYYLPIFSKNKLTVLKLKEHYGSLGDLSDAIGFIESSYSIQTVIIKRFRHLSSSIETRNINFNNLMKKVCIQTILCCRDRLMCKDIGVMLAKIVFSVKEEIFKKWDKK